MRRCQLLDPRKTIAVQCNHLESPLRYSGERPEFRVEGQLKGCLENLLTTRSAGEELGVMEVVSGLDATTSLD